MIKPNSSITVILTLLDIRGLFCLVQKQISCSKALGCSLLAYIFQNFTEWFGEFTCTTNSSRKQIGEEFSQEITNSDSDLLKVVLTMGYSTSY